ncbi:MAG: hypothetical protein ACRD10_02050 [Terriglobia bacterium]
MSASEASGRAHRAPLQPASSSHAAMFRRIGRWVIVIALCSPVVGVFSVPLHADEFRRVQQYAVRMFSYGTLTLATRTGDLDIEGWDSPRLSIDAEKVVESGSAKKAAELYGLVGVHLTGRDHEISLSTTYPKRGFWRPFRDESKLSVNFTIHMPYDANVRLKCVDGDVTVSGITGKEVLDVNYGDVEVDVPHVYALRLLDAHSWLGYVQSDLHGESQDATGFSKSISFMNLEGEQVIVVRVRMGGVFIYGEED